MKPICIHEKLEIENFLRKNTRLHLFSIGDLDDFFWPYTTWYALKNRCEQITQLALLYIGTKQPNLLCFTEGSRDEMRTLLQSIVHLLPQNMYAHLSTDLADVLATGYHLQAHTMLHKMALVDTTQVMRVDTTQVIPLSVEDNAEIYTLYHACASGDFFDPRMLETGCYYGLRLDGLLVSIAGIHVYSQHYKVAALGNVATHPDYRRRGLATQVCAKVCLELLRTVEHIGLNVLTDNTNAIHCYERLGFIQIGSYEKYDCVRTTRYF